MQHDGRISLPGISGSSTGTTVVSPAAGNNLVCISGTWQYPAYQFGSTSASCASGAAGAIQWTGSVFQGCDGSTWNTFSFGGGTITLGTAASATNPQVSGDATTGLYSGAAGTVSVAASGTSEMTVTSTGVGIGTTNPTYSLHVTSSAANKVDIADVIYVTASNGLVSTPVGIGTTPSGNYNLSVGSNGLYTPLITIGQSGISDAWGLQLNGTTIRPVHVPTSALFVGYGSQGGASFPSGNLLVSGNVSIGTTSPVSSLDLSQKTDALALPSGTTAQRPGTPLNGEIRFNSSTQGIEGYFSGAWNALGGGGGTATLGTSVSATSPQRSADASTGFYTAGTGLVDVAVSGSQKIEWSAAGENIVIGSLNLAGLNGLWQDNANTDLIVGRSAFPTTYVADGSGYNGQGNVAVGWQSLTSNTTGYRNTATGVNALANNTTGCCNSAFGYGALAADTYGGGNTAVGISAMGNNTIGSNNTAIGLNALSSNNIGINNVAVGYYNLLSNTSGQGNVAVGYKTLSANSSGSYNTAVGIGALNHTTAGNNVGIGVSAGQGNTSGVENIIIVDGAGATSLTGNYNILIGSNSTNIPAEPTSYFLNIGNLLTGNMSNSNAVGKQALFLQSAASSVDYVQIAGGASGAPGTVTISAQGTDSNVSLNMSPKGTGSTNFTTGNMGIGTVTPHATLDVNGPVLNECVTVSTLPSGYTGTDGCVSMKHSSSAFTTRTMAIAFRRTRRLQQKPVAASEPSSERSNGRESTA